MKMKIGKLEGTKENRISNKQANNVCKFMHTPCCHVHEDNNDGVVEFFCLHIFFLLCVLSLHYMVLNWLVM